VSPTQPLELSQVFPECFIKCQFISNHIHQQTLAHN